MIEPYEGMAPRIHPTAFVHAAGTVIGEVTVGEESSVWPSAVLRGDQGPITVGARTSIQDGAVCHVTGGRSTTVVGDRVTVGHGAIIHGAHVGDDCIVGMGSILLDNAVIAPFTIVGAGALVPPGKTFPEGVLLVGSPAKVVRAITDAERGWIEHSWQEYVKLGRQYRAG
jgi:gamma-carbonic anhydrase